MRCDRCDQEYEDFRTNLSFRAVRDELWGEVRAGARRWITRHTVLGRWRERKLALWAYYHAGCDDQSASA